MKKISVRAAVHRSSSTSFGTVGLQTAHTDLMLVRSTEKLKTFLPTTRRECEYFEKQHYHFIQDLNAR